MARRPVFTPLGTRPHVREVSTEFTLHPGLSLKQEQRSVDSLHRSFLSAHPGARMLEVSGGSPLVLGAELSAFRLEPRTFFYDWLYVSALAGHPELVNELEHRAAFTDIEFNPKRSINCQAHSVALFQGIAGGWRRDSLRPPDHPRSRGVYVPGHRGDPEKPGSSPLARGLHELRDIARQDIRIIPARAGFTPCKPAPGRDDTDHPRSRGVYDCAWVPVAQCLGSSPLARGLPAAAHMSAFPARIIPARAGFTDRRRRGRRRPGDHPRSRGVYDRADEECAARAGSSPLARGLHCDRAHGGLLCRDHPRSRGVYMDEEAIGQPDYGSSPLARGLQKPALAFAGVVGIIPARAGFTRPVGGRGPGFEDHPRSRGVY